MSFNQIVSICGLGGALALALGLASPALADHGHGAMPPPDVPDMRPAWQGGPPMPGMPDARARDAWLRECHRRTEHYYDGRRDESRRHRRHRDDHYDRYDRGPGYSYCEAYFDDWYRSGGYARQAAYAMPVVAYAQPMVMAPAPAAQPSQNCVETVTTEYVPVRTRIIPRRPTPRAVPDKRIRIAPDKRQSVN
jgi:hypothetical protein